MIRLELKIKHIYGQWAYSYTSPQEWDKLPLNIKSVQMWVFLKLV